MDFGPSARDYAAHRKGFPDSFFERLPLSGRLLDLGTGTGSVARGYAERGAEAVGLDLSLRMLQSADGVPLRVNARAEALPFFDASFDAVIAGQCWHWFDRQSVAAECLRVLRPAGEMIIAHFDYLADRDGPARETERIILRHNPTWAWSGKSGIYDRWRPDLAAFAQVESFFYDEDIPYSHEAWRGRIRACNGVIAVQDEEDRARVDHELSAMLAAKFPDPVIVPHRVFVVRGLKPG